jgi:hypothetical protein
MISKDPKEQTALAKAAKNPTLVINSDWNNFTSWDYLKAQEDSNYDIL